MSDCTEPITSCIYCPVGATDIARVECSSAVLYNYNLIQCTGWQESALITAQNEEDIWICWSSYTPKGARKSALSL